MADVLELIENLNNLDIEKVVKQSISITATTIAELNREQLKSGKRADNSNMPNYSKASVNLFGKPQGPIMLFDTGNFHASITVNVKGDEILTTAKDLYNLSDKYTDDIYGLADVQQEIYNENVFYQELATEIEKEIGLKFE
jgi:hypothetical protein